jgi:hypothetical protein
MLRLTDLQNVRAVVLMLHPRIATPVRDFAIELNGEMFAIDGKLGDCARAILKSAVETCSLGAWCLAVSKHLLDMPRQHFREVG